MKPRLTVTGVETVKRNLNGVLRGVQERSRDGLWAAGLKVKRESMKRTPREYGHLRASNYSRFVDETKARKATVEVGFTSRYAIYVHENVAERWRGRPRRSGIGVYWGPSGARSKFLSSALADLRQEILRTIAAYARLRGGK